MKIKLTFNFIFSLLVLAALSLPISGMVCTANAEDDVKVIGNNDVPDKELSRMDIQQIFLGKKTRWSDNKKITIVTSKNEDLNEKFLTKFVGKTPSQFRNYWKNLVFTGKGKEPIAFSNDKALIEHIVSNEGSIGYVSSESSPDGVTLIIISN
ncbi:MAG: substrate-binding domain-containing protein [Desulfobacterales bacterium]|nr:substrate-binding domain-containing protein [Desulfobacterales bacterium]